MYRTMLRDGHEPPEIVEEAGDVVVRLAGGAPDLAIRTYFDRLEDLDEVLGQSAAATIAVHELIGRTPLRPEELAALAQRTPAEALEILGRLERVGSVERLLNRSRSFRLTGRSREALGSAIGYRRSSMDEHWHLIRAYLDENPDISREQASALLEVTPQRATAILGKLRTEGRIEPVGTTRGRSVRYRAV